MNRPFVALSILLASLASTLGLVGSAQSQTAARDGNRRPNVCRLTPGERDAARTVCSDCPLSGIYDWSAFGVPDFTTLPKSYLATVQRWIATSRSARPQRVTAPLSGVRPPAPELAVELTSSDESPMAAEMNFRSGYDPVYDRCVYGVTDEPALEQSSAEVFAASAPADEYNPYRCAEWCCECGGYYYEDYARYAGLPVEQFPRTPVARRSTVREALERVAASLWTSAVPIGLDELSNEVRLRAEQLPVAEAWNELAQRFSSTEYIAMALPSPASTAKAPKVTPCPQDACDEFTYGCECWSGPRAADLARVSGAVDRSVHEATQPILLSMAQMLDHAAGALQGASVRLTRIAGVEVAAGSPTQVKR